MGWKGIITLLPLSNNGGWGLLSHTVGLELIKEIKERFETFKL
jgi:hypothetical protein